jgi:hypothetical protein
MEEKRNRREVQRETKRDKNNEWNIEEEDGTIGEWIKEILTSGMLWTLELASI